MTTKREALKSAISDLEKLSSNIATNKFLKSRLEKRQNRKKEKPFPLQNELQKSHPDLSGFFMQ